MKKTAILLFFFLVSCAPQVTVTSEVTVTSLPPTATAMPMPTLHPQFVVLQEQVAASGERFTLMPDGTIQDGAIPISGLNVDKNGVMTLQVGDQIVELSFEDLSFSDNGIEVKGYTFNKETGEWQPALTPEQQAGVDAATADVRKIGADPSLLTIAHVEGRGVVCTEIATGAEVCVDGRFDLPWAVLHITNASPTDIKPTKGFSSPDFDVYKKVFEPQIMAFTHSDPYVVGILDAMIYVDAETNAWAHVIGDYFPATRTSVYKQIFYLNTDGEFTGIDVMNMSYEDLDAFRVAQTDKAFE